MKNYTYTCRNKDGTLKRGQLSAPDRADALRQLKSQGHLPLSISEGPSAPPPNARKRLAALTAATALAIAIGMVLLRPTLSRQQPDNPLSPQATSAMRPSLKNKTQETLTGHHQTPTQEDAGFFADATDSRLSPLTHMAAADNAAPLEDETSREESAPPAFKTMSEQLIAMLGQPGEERPPLPDLSSETLEEDFLRASTNILVITEDDSDTLAAAKENVAWVKSYIEEAKRLGWTPGEYIRELENVRKQQAMDRRQALAIMAEVERDFPDDATAVRTELNRELEEKGILPLDQL